MSDALKIVNDSGFPLQIALANQLNAAADSTGWNVLFAEHSWSNQLDEMNGFIDLVVHSRNGPYYLVVECKRVRESTWLFFNSAGTASDRRHAKTWVSWYADGQSIHHNWADLPVEPMCPEVQFCALRGQTANDRNTLIERIGAGLTSSTEGLANELRDYRPEGATDFKIYLNVIVTTADIQVGVFDPATISLQTGALPDATFTSVPFIRFRKQLSLRANRFTPEDYANGKKIESAKESTVFIVRADALIDFIREVEVPEKNVYTLSAS